MTDFMTGDAFKEDRVNEKMYGVPITEDNCSICFLGDEEMPEPMCNTVCYFKSEEQNPNCRNLLAVSKSYICYTVKKSKLRVIHSESGKMVLLLGHELPVVDLKFSKADSSVVCSVDNAISGESATNPTAAHVFLWRLSHSGDIVTSIILAQFGFGATIVEPHPHNADVFAVAKGGHVGIITTSLSSGGSLQFYEELPLHALVFGDILDLSFSTDGKMLLVVTAYDIIAYMLPQADLLTQGKGTLTQMNQMIDASVRKSNISSITCLPCGFLTASRGTSTSATACAIELTLHAADVGDTFLQVIQSMQITLPIYTSGGRPDETPNETPNDIKLAFKSTGEDSVNLIVLCHKLSNILVCFAVDPSRAKSKRKQLPLCHATFFDLKSPVFTLDTTTIKGRNYYSDDEVEHLEVACYQVQGAKTAVYQYHFNCCSLYSADEEAAKESADRFVESLRDSDKAASRSLVELPRESVTAPTPFIASLTAGTVTHSIELEPCVIMKPVESAPEEFSWSEAEASSEETSCVSIESVPESQSPLPEILRSTAVKGKSIMSMLTKMKVPATAVSSIPESATVPAPISKSASPAAPTPAVPVHTTTSQDVTPTTGPEPTPQEPPVTVARYMLGVIGNLFPEAPAVEVDVIPEPVQDMDAVVLPEEEDGEDDWAEASAAVAVTSSSGTRPSPPAPALVGREALDHALASSKASRAVPPPPPPQPIVLDMALHEKVNDLTRGVYALAGSILDLKTISTSAAEGMAVADNAAQQAGAERHASEQRVEKAMETMKAELMSDMRDLMASTQAKNKLEEQTAKIEAANAASARDKVQLLAINKSMKAVVEVEMKKAVEDALKSKAWRDSLLSQIVEQVQAELAPILSQKVRETVKDTVRDTVKGALATSFRTAFESSLLPAFQAGTDRMFAQVQASFDQGMKGLAEQSRASQECSDECTLELSKEVAALRSTVATLETRIAELSSRPTAASVDVVTAPLPDPVLLLQEGNALEAVECALELRDIDKLVNLLSFMTPTQLVMNCNRLIQLCTAHQLAEDLASKEPSEGISRRLEWLNSLIFGLLFTGSGATQDTSAADHMKPVFADIGRFLAAATESVISQISAWKSSPDAANKAYVPNLIDFKYLSIAVDGVNFTKAG